MNIPIIQILAIIGYSLIGLIAISLILAVAISDPQPGKYTPLRIPFERKNSDRVILEVTKEYIKQKDYDRQLLEEQAREADQLAAREAEIANKYNLDTNDSAGSF